MEGLEEAISLSLLKRKLEFTLKKEQMECISSIVAGRDVLAVLPTGYGKSLIYQIFPNVCDKIFDAKNSIVIVISPLNALMCDQVVKLNEQGITACMIQGHSVLVGENMTDDTSVKLPLDKLENPCFQILYMHPEVCVNERKVLNIFNSTIYQERVRCVVVDEAHLVLNW
jgi:ATP-dependent DNA helicase RecQ